MTKQLIFAGPGEKATKKILWLTDLHLDAAGKQNHRLFFEQLVAQVPDAILVGGDISNGVASLLHLKHLAKFIKVPFYFVLGNHDYYYGSIKTIRGLAMRMSKEFQNTHYLTGGGVVELTPSTALIGHDGWSDGRVGNFMSSTIMLNDYLLIEELKNLSQKERLHFLNQLGTEAAQAISQALEEALKKYQRVILLTHTPPFKEVCLYEGKPPDENWTPHFVCKAMGDVLLAIASRYLEKEILVLCGHSHAGADVRIASNLRVLVGQSELGLPTIQGVIWI